MKFSLSHMKFAALRILPSMYSQNIEMYDVTMPVIYNFPILVKKKLQKLILLLFNRKDL